MSIFDDIKKDREAGLPGDWLQEHRKGPDGMYRTQVFPEDDADNSIATVHWHSIRRGNGVTETDREELSRRIARVPQLEAIALAAGELIAAIKYCDGHVTEIAGELEKLEEACK